MAQNNKRNYTQSFTYDKIGNMLTKVSTESKYPNVSVSALNYTNAYSYYTDAPHRAEIIGDMYYKYDNNGNVIEERQGGHREETVGGTLRLRCTKNIYIGETRIASKLNYKGEGTDYEDIHTYYYHTDHLSSSNVVTDADGEVYEHMEYTPKDAWASSKLACDQPYGEKWILDQNDNSKYDMIPYRFTAKEWDEETGLYYMSARYMNPETSRWVSSDPAGWGLVNPMDDKGNLRSGFNLVESMNPYSYTGHNPVRYNDPTGLDSADAEYSRQEVMNETYSRNYSQDAEDNKNTVEPLLNTDDVQPGYPTWRGHNIDGLPNEPGAQDGITWCNRLLYRAFKALGGDGSKITNENGIGYTKANEMVDLLRAGVASGNVIPAKGGAAQYYANEGMLVIAGLKARRGNGHVALVVGDQFKYDRSRGPLTMQAGSKVGNIYASEGFGEASFGSIEYFVILDGFLK